jgi:hypothetical protein
MRSDVRHADGRRGEENRKEHRKVPPVKTITFEALVDVGDEVTLSNGVKAYVTQVSKDIDAVVWYAVKYLTAEDIKVPWVRQRDISEPTS